MRKVFEGDKEHTYIPSHRERQLSLRGHHSHSMVPGGLDVTS